MKKILTLLAISLLLASCKKKDVNTIVTDGTSISESILIDTFSIKTSVILDDYKVTTENLTYHSVGGYVDDYFGLLTSSPYFKLEDNNQLSDDDVIDSAFVEFSYSFFVKGDTTKILDLELYETIQEFIDDSSYSHTSSLSLASSPISTSSFVPLPTTSNVVSFRVSDDWIASYKSRDIQNDFEGKALCIKAKAGTDASIISFNKSTLNLVIYGKKNDVSFDVSIGLNTANDFDSFTFDRSSTTISDLKKSGDAVESSSNQDRMLVQSGTGINSKVEISGLRNFLNNNPKVQIDKAEIIFHVDETTTGGINAVAPEAMKVYEANGNIRSRNSNNELDGLILPDNSVYSNSRATFSVYDAANLTYTLSITSYLRSVTSEGKEMSDLILFAQYGLNDIDLNGIFSPNLGDVYQITNSAVLYNENAIEAKKPKLNVYYTINK